MSDDLADVAVPVPEHIPLQNGSWHVRKQICEIIKCNDGQGGYCWLLRVWSEHRELLLKADFFSTEEEAWAWVDNPEHVPPGTLCEFKEALDLKREE